MLPDIQLIVPYEVEGCGNVSDRILAFSDPGQKLCVSHGSGSARIFPRGPGPVLNISGKAINFT
jgi:hypothetical protein